MSNLIHYRHGSGASILAKRLLQPIMLAITLTVILTLEVKFDACLPVISALLPCRHIAYSHWASCIGLAC